MNNNLDIPYDADEAFIYISEQGGESAQPEKTTNVQLLCPKLDIEYLFKSRYQQLKGFIRKRIHNVHDAEDIAQNTYIEALKNAGNYKGLSRPDVWLFGIALNLVRNHSKKESNRARMWEKEYGHEYSEYNDIDNNPCDLIDRTQRIYIVDQTLSKLPKEMKQVFQAIVIDNKSYQEAASYLGVPTGTIRSRLSRARERIKEASFA